MVDRICNLSKNHSFFLFGARGTGKSTWLRQTPWLKDGLWIDLLDPETEANYLLRPQLLIEQAQKLTKGSWVIIDEVQKAPRLLDCVHSLIEGKKLKFALTGSSSRKLRRGGANLLAGRAFLNSLFPFSIQELGAKFNLIDVLKWGSLPKIFEFEQDQEKSKFLKSYSLAYIKDEVQTEQLVRNLEAFRSFLPIAGQMNGEIINYNRISEDVGIDHKTIANYFQILEETYIGSFLEPYSRSIRKKQSQKNKFYFFDTGVLRAIEGKTNSVLNPGTSEFGKYFETWFINECFRLNSYYEKDFKLSFLRVNEDVEVDLVIEPPGKKPILIEIKSSELIGERQIKNLSRFADDFPKSRLICVSREKHPKTLEGVDVLPFNLALREIFK